MWPQALISGFCVIVCPPEFSRDFLQGEEHNAVNSLVMELSLLLLCTFCSNATSKLAIEKRMANSLLASLCVLRRSTSGCAQRVGRGSLLAQQQQYTCCAGTWAPPCSMRPWRRRCPCSGILPCLPIYICFYLVEWEGCSKRTALGVVLCSAGSQLLFVISLKAEQTSSKLALFACIHPSKSTPCAAGLLIAPCAYLSIYRNVKQ